MVDLLHSFLAVVLAVAFCSKTCLGGVAAGIYDLDQDGDSDSDNAPGLYANNLVGHGRLLPNGQLPSSPQDGSNTWFSAGAPLGMRSFDGFGDAEQEIASKDADNDDGDVILRVPNKVMYHLIRRFGLRSSQLKQAALSRSSSEFSRRKVRRLLRRLIGQTKKHSQMEPRFIFGSAAWNRNRDYEQSL